MPLDSLRLRGLCGASGQRSTADHGVFERKRVLQAIVTFSSPFGRQACLQQYPSGLLHRFLQSATHRLRGARLSVAPAPPPSTIIWENLGYGTLNRLGRQVWMHCFTYLIHPLALAKCPCTCNQLGLL